MKTAATLALAAFLCALPACAQRALKPRTERIKTEAGTMTVTYSNRATAADVAVPFYPGARAVSGSCYTLKNEKGKLARLRAQVMLRTRAGADKVASFYKKALPGAQLRWEKPAAKAVLWKKAADETWIITLQPGQVRIQHSRAPLKIEAPEPDKHRKPARGPSSRQI